MILYRYITREFIKPFLYSLSTIMLLFMMQLAIQLLPRVLYKGVPGAVIAELFAVNLAHIAVLSVPMSLLISMLMVFGKLTADNELAAIKAGGHSIASLLPPVFAISGFMAVIMLFFNTAVLPEANHHGSTLLSDIMRKKPAAMIEPGILIKDFPGYALLVDSVEHETGKLFGIKIFSEEKGNKPKVTVAESGTIFMTADESHVELTLFDGETHTEGSRGAKEHYRIQFAEQLVYIKNVNSDLVHSTDKAKGNREKTNDQLLLEVEKFKEKRQEHTEQHDKKIKDLLVMLDSIYVTPSEDTTISEDTTDDSSLTAIITDSAANAPPEVATKVTIGNDTIITESAVTLRAREHKALLNKIEKSGSGRGIKRVLRSEQTRAKLRLERAAKESKKINGHLVEVHKKYALAISVIIFALLGVPLGIISKSGNVAISVSYSLFFYIIYYTFLVAGENLSENRGVPPGLAMWIGNIILSILAFYLIAGSVRESQFGIFKAVMALFNWKRIVGSKLITGIMNLASSSTDKNQHKFISSTIASFKKLVFFPAFLVRFIMPALPGYILGRFFSFFFSVTVGLTVLTVVIDYISNISRLEGALPKELIWYYVYFMAWFFSIVLPMALLIATMMTIGSFAKTNELTAIKAAGISMVKMTIPILIIGFFFSVFSFYFSETVLPISNKRRELLKETFSARRNNRPIPTGKKTYKHDFYYFSDPLTAYRFTHFQTLPPRGDKVIRYRFGKGELLETTEIKKMVYEDSTWVMLNGISRDFTTEEYNSQRFGREIDTNIKDNPQEMVRSVGSSADKLSYGELKEILKKAQQRGEDVSKYEADLHFKFALPLMNFIVILIGVAVTARSDKRGGSVHFGMGMGLVAIYWAVSQFLLVFGQSGQLSPILAAWSGTIVFLIIGLILYRKASQ